jgi:hypothetical protein
MSDLSGAVDGLERESWVKAEKEAHFLQFRD